MSPRRMVDLAAGAAATVAALGVCAIAALVMTPLASSVVSQEPLAHSARVPPE
jgi:hypothetical protein